MHTRFSWLFFFQNSGNVAKLLQMHCDVMFDIFIEC